MTNPDRPTQASKPVCNSDRQPVIDRGAVQHLDLRARHLPSDE
jgi:hypothetical protein